MIANKHANRGTSARNGGGNPVPSSTNSQVEKVKRLSKANNKCNSKMVENKLVIN